MHLLIDLGNSNLIRKTFLYPEEIVTDMLGFKVSLPIIILTLVLSVSGMQLESADIAYGQSNSTSNSTASESPMGSEIVLLSQKLKKASFGLRHVIGQVKNIGPEAADYVAVHLTTYNKDGEVIGTAFTYAEPSTLKSGQKSTFEISADTDNFKGMDSYELSLDWLNHRDSAQGYVQDAQLYKSTPN